MGNSTSRLALAPASGWRPGGAAGQTSACIRAQTGGRFHSPPHRPYPLRWFPSSGADAEPRRAEAFSEGGEDDEEDKKMIQRLSSRFGIYKRKDTDGNELNNFKTIKTDLFCSQ